MARLRLGIWLAAGGLAAPLLAAAVAGAAAAEPPRRPSPTAAAPSFADLVDKLLPAVVNVATVHEAEAPPPRELALPPGLPLDDLFRDLLERQRRGRNAPDKPARRETVSLGSGFIIDPAGWIVTNDHVVADATRIRVTLYDGTTLGGRVVGRDARMDLALVKVEAHRPLRAVAWGRSDEVRIGDWVLTIGNPFGLVNSVAAGIVSGRNRDLHTGPYDEYIQTDAAMNTGNSGGPMFDMSGRVIGIDTAIYTQTGGSVGVGFAIPSSLAQPVVEALRRDGKVTRGFIGVRLQPVTDEMAALVALDHPRGALVTQVAPDGPAAAANLKRGDVIVGVGAERVATVRHLQRIIAGLPVDQTVGLVVWRDHREVPLQVRIGVLPEERAVASAAPAAPAAPGAGERAELFGLVLGALTPETRQARALAASAPGVAITEVAPGSPAEDAGLIAGDLILQLDGSAVASPDDAARRLRHAASSRKPILMLVDRDGERQFVAVRMHRG
jgi:serine protease Do